MANRTPYNDPEDDTEVFETIRATALPPPAPDAETDAKQSDVELMWHLINSLGSRSSISVTIEKKIDGKINGFEQVVVLPGDEFTQAIIDEIQDLKGAGEYRIKISQKGQPRGTKVLPLHLSATLSQLRRTRDQGRASATDPQVLGVLAQQSELLHQMQQQLRQPLAVPPPPLGLREIIELMVSMKQLIGDNAAPRHDPIDLMLKGAQFVKDIGGSGGETNAMDLMRDVLKTMQEVSKNAPQRLPGPVGPPPTLQRTVTPATAPKPPAEDKEMIGMFQVVHGLLNAAKAGQNPADIARTALSSSDVDQLEKWVNDPKLFDSMCALVPECKNYKNWFDQLLIELKRLIELEYEDDSAAEEQI